MKKDTRFKKGQIPWNRGIPNSLETRIKIGIRNKGKKLSEETKRKIGKNGFHYGMLGKKHTEEWKQKMSKIHRGKNQWNWKGGLTNSSAKIRNSYRYRQWISDVFTKDNFICQECEQRGGKLHAHHIKQFSKIINENNIRNYDEALNCDELWNINNGITLCVECHKKTDTYLNKKHAV